MARETEVQSQVESYERLKKWYLISPCLTLSIVRYVPRVKWSNPRKGVAPSTTPRCCSNWKGNIRVYPDYGRQLIRFQVFQSNTNNLHTVILFKVFQFNTNNFHIDKWFQVFLSNTNNLHTVIWFQVSLSNTNNFHTVTWFQVFLFDKNNLHTVIWFQVCLSNTNNLQTVV